MQEIHHTISVEQVSVGDPLHIENDSDVVDGHKYSYCTKGNFVTADQTEPIQLMKRVNLRDSCIVFLCAGCPDKEFIYRLAFDEGIHSIIIDNHDSWAQGLVRKGIIGHFVGVDMSAPTEAVLSQCIFQLSKLGVRPDGVCSFVELAVSLSARLAKAFGCPGPDPSSVSDARDKFEARKCFRRAGLAHVRNAVIVKEKDLEFVSELVGFPAVLKPISGAASLGVQKVESKEELLTVYRRVSQELSTLVVSSGALERKTESIVADFDREVGVSAKSVIDSRIMMEEYLDGPEVDVDLIMSEGVCQYCKAIDNGPTSEPFFAETWAALPSLMDPQKVSELETLAVDAVKALGFMNGVFHVELKYTSQGPRIIEVNARMGGGPTRMIHKLSFGIDLVVEQFKLAVGIASNPSVAPTPLTRVAYAFINARTSGTVDDVSFMSTYADREHVVWVHPYVKPFERFIGPDDGHPTWLGDIVVAHADGHEALRIVKEMENDIANEFTRRRIKNPTLLVGLSPTVKF